MLIKCSQHPSWPNQRDNNGKWHPLLVFAVSDQTYSWVGPSSLVSCHWRRFSDVIVTEMTPDLVMSLRWPLTQPCQWWPPPAHGRVTAMIPDQQSRHWDDLNCVTKTTLPCHYDDTPVSPTWPHGVTAMTRPISLRWPACSRGIWPTVDNMMMPRLLWAERSQPATNWSALVHVRTVSSQTRGMAHLLSSNQ